MEQWELLDNTTPILVIASPLLFHLILRKDTSGQRHAACRLASLAAPSCSAIPSPHQNPRFVVLPHVFPFWLRNLLLAPPTPQIKPLEEGSGRYRSKSAPRAWELLRAETRAQQRLPGAKVTAVPNVTVPRVRQYRSVYSESSKTKSERNKPAPKPRASLSGLRCRADGTCGCSTE